MQRQLYPAECLDDSLEAHLARYPSGGHALYLTVVAALLVAVGMLPHVSVRVAVRSAGIIRPVTEKQQVRARVAGVVERASATENRAVRAGDTLVVLRASTVDEHLALLSAQLAEKTRRAGDLARLATVSAALPLRAPRLETDDYRREYGQFIGEMRDNQLTVDRARRELSRVRALHARHFAASSDLDDARLQLAHATAQGAIIVERYRSRWQSALTSVRSDMTELASRQREAREERALYTVTAPTTGTLEQVASISPGSYVQAGEQLAVVSPSADLVAEVYVTPRDIGLLHRGTPVRMMIDAFDHDEWGTISGAVRMISSDFVQVDGRPMFRVTCALDERRLSLRNGVGGELRKGMTLQAHFLVARRTLFQLISDDVSDWLDPSRAPAGTSGLPRAADAGRGA